MILADLLTQVQSSDFIKFVIGGIVTGSLYLLVTKIGDRMTTNFVRKDELKTTLDVFKADLVRELVTAQDLRIFKLEYAKELEEVMKEGRHTLRGELQAIKLASDEAALLMAQRMSSIEAILARIDEHLKIVNPPLKIV